MKVAKLVYVSLVTRVVVDENATDDQIVDAAKPRLMDTIKCDLDEDVAFINDDVECPYDPELDDVL